VYAVVAAQSAAAQFFNPSRLAMLGRIVPPDHQPRAGGMLQATTSLATIAGEPLGAVLLFGFGVRWACVIDAVSFAGSFLAVRSIRLPRARPGDGQGRPGFGAEWRAGLRFFARNRVLLAISSGVIIAMMGLGAVNVLLVFFVTGNLHAPAGWLGPMGATFGAGMVTGALASGWVSGRTGAGRVMGVFNPLQQLAAIASMGLAGLLASTVLRGLHVVLAGVRFGTVDSIFGAGALLVLAAGLAVFAPLRRPGLASAAEAGG
jgi:predicted MFS family arabinose efflux permease